MSLAFVLENLNKIANTPSTNDKVALLKKYLTDESFLKVVKFALSGDMMFGVKNLPKVSTRSLKDPEDIFTLLKVLSYKPGTNDADKLELAKAASIDKETFEVVNRIINKDLKCGVNAKLVNKARLGTVNTVPYMRCSTEAKIKNILYPAVIQEKADGMFVNVMINKTGKIKIITRNGKTVHQLEYLKNIIRKGRGLVVKRPGKHPINVNYGIANSSQNAYLYSRVYTGELLVKKKGKILPRHTGNGILNSCLNNTADPNDAKCVILRLWDSLPLKNFYDGYHDVLYNTRLFETQAFVSTVNDREFVDMVMTKRVENYEEAREFYALIRKANGEGAILKNLHLLWKNHTSPDAVKMKNVSDCELEIVGWAPGKEGSKYELCMGAIQCQSKDGLLRVSVGSGFSDEQREADWDMAEGAIVTIDYEGVIQDKRDKNKYSLFLPRFKEVREDRDEADTIHDILER